MNIFTNASCPLLLLMGGLLAGMLCLSAPTTAQVPAQPINQPCTACEPTSIHAADLDGDGNPDVLSTSQIDDKVAWHKNNGGSYGAQQVISTASDKPQTVTAADLDGDNDLDVISGSKGDDKLVWYENQIGESGADSDGFGPAQVISSSNGDVLSVAAGKLDGDGKADIVIGARDGVFWFESQIGESGADFGSASQISSTTLTPIEVHVANLNSDSSPDVLYMHNGNFGEVVWHENIGGGFGSKTLITDNVSQPNSVTAANVDDDSPLEVISASNDGKVAWYDYDSSSGSFQGQTVINSDANPLSVSASDADGDGDAEVYVATQVIGGDDRVEWYESQVGESGSDSDGFGSRVVLTTSMIGVQQVIATNLDATSGAEVLSLSQVDDKIAWYQNGSNGYGGPQAVNTWPDAIRPTSIVSTSLDADSDPDMLVTSQVDDEVSWYENAGGGSFSAQKVLSSDARKPQEVVAADLTGDDKPEAIVASQGRDKSGMIAWYDNQTGEGSADSDEFGPEQIIAAPGDVNMVAAANLDGDSDTDVLAVYGTYSRSVVWYENKINEGGGFGAEQIIASNLYNLLSIHVADLNGGAPDVIAGYGYDPGKVVWFDNTGGSFSSEKVITNAADEQVSALETAHVDGDSDLDVLSGSYGGSSTTIAWYENMIGQGGDADGFGALQSISSAISLPEDLHTADVNGDSKVDVLSASSGDDKVAWYKNTGGSFSNQIVIYSINQAPVQGAIDVSAADVNGDSKMDVLSGANGREEIAWHENTGTVLPVELAGLDATVDDGTVTLSWTTASETGNAGFRIQRRVGARERGSGETWTTVGKVNGAGTTTEAQSYRFTDAELPYEADALTYRLKQVDTDGSANYSKTITVERGVNEVQLLGTYPNPARQQATVRYALPERQEVEVQLYDVLGRQVRAVVSDSKEGRHERTLDVSGLSSGVYFLRLQADGKIRTQKITVMR